AEVYQHQSRYDEAVDVLQKMLAEPGLLPFAESSALGQLGPTYQLRGSIHHATGKLRAARADYHNADKICERLSQPEFQKRAIEAGVPGSRSHAEIQQLIQDSPRWYLALRGGLDYALGQLEADEGRVEEALRRLDAGLGKLEAVRKEEPGNPVV